jgi:hypothetical protein
MRLSEVCAAAGFSSMRQALQSLRGVEEFPRYSGVDSAYRRLSGVPEQRVQRHGNIRACKFLREVLADEHAQWCRLRLEGGAIAYQLDASKILRTAADAELLREMECVDGVSCFDNGRYLWLRWQPHAGSPTIAVAELQLRRVLSAEMVIFDRLMHTFRNAFREPLDRACFPDRDRALRNVLTQAAVVQANKFFEGFVPRVLDELFVLLADCIEAKAGRANCTMAKFEELWPQAKVLVYAQLYEEPASDGAAEGGGGGGGARASGEKDKNAVFANMAAASECGTTLEMMLVRRSGKETAHEVKVSLDSIKDAVAAKFGGKVDALHRGWTKTLDDAYEHVLRRGGCKFRYCLPPPRPGERARSVVIDIDSPLALDKLCTMYYCLRCLCGHGVGRSTIANLARNVPDFTDGIILDDDVRQDLNKFKQHMLVYKEGIWFSARQVCNCQNFVFAHAKVFVQAVSLWAVSNFPLLAVKEEEEEENRALWSSNSAAGGDDDDGGLMGALDGGNDDY